MEALPKKLSKHHVILQWTTNVRLTSQESPNMLPFPFDIESKSLVCIKTDGNREFMPLSKAWQGHFKDQKTLFSYNNFITGTLPKTQLTKVDPSKTHCLERTRQEDLKNLALHQKVVMQARKSKKPQARLDAQI